MATASLRIVVAVAALYEVVATASSSTLLSFCQPTPSYHLPMPLMFLCSDISCAKICAVPNPRFKRLKIIQGILEIGPKQWEGYPKAD